MAVNNWRVLLKATGGAGEQIVTGIHVKADKAGVSAYSADDVAGLCKDWLETPYKNVLTTADLFNEIEVLEHKGPEGGIPSQAGRFPNIAGTLSGVDGKLPRECCVWVNVKSNIPLRAARSGHHLPPPRNGTALNTDGGWNISHGYWALVTAWVNALKNGHDDGIAGVDGHLSTIIWSYARVKRDQSPYTWDAQNVVPSTKVAFLRSRYSIP